MGGGATLNATQTAITIDNQGFLILNSSGKLNLNRGSGTAVSILSGGTMSVGNQSEVNISTGDRNGFSLQSGGQLTQLSGSIITTGFKRAGTFDFQGGLFAVDQGIFNNNSAQFTIDGVGSGKTFEWSNTQGTCDRVTVRPP